MNETGQYCVYTSYLAPERLRELKEYETFHCQVWWGGGP